jgi:hypothetical protein
MKINIFLSNHKQGMADDITNILSNIFERSNFEVVESRLLDPYAINIIIDEFTNFIINFEITQFKKKYPEAKIIFLLTEFFSTKFFVKSLNLFESNIFDLSLISIIKPLIFYVRSDYTQKPGLQEWFLFFLYLPIFLIYFPLLLLMMFCRLIKIELLCNLRLKVRRLIYMELRYSGLLTMIKYADALIDTHNLISASIPKNLTIKKFGTIYPEFNIEDIRGNLLVEKQMSIEMTGTITPYRKMWIRRINHTIFLKSLRSIMNFVRGYNFSNKQEKGKSAFSMHPPQSKKWKYCSPIRIYRAVAVDFNIPIITKNFSQHPIEDIAIFYEGYETLLNVYHIYNNTKLLKIFFKRLKLYNEKVITLNDKVVCEMLKNLNRKS